MPQPSSILRGIATASRSPGVAMQDVSLENMLLNVNPSDVALHRWLGTEWMFIIP